MLIIRNEGASKIARLVLSVSRLALTAHLAVKAFQQFLNELPAKLPRVRNAASRLPATLF